MGNHHEQSQKKNKKPKKMYVTYEYITDKGLKHKELLKTDEKKTKSLTD